MAYLRGDYYIWADGADRLYIWSVDGADTWADSGWATALSDPTKACGVSIPEAVLDEYVVMRFAELVASRALSATIDRALRHGNFGGGALAARADAIKKAAMNLK